MVLLTDKDPGPAFIDPRTQKLLKSMTRLQLDKVYRKRAILNNKVEYKFMTTEQIEDEIKAAIRKADALLQMPPIVMVNKKLSFCGNKKLILSFTRFKKRNRRSSRRIPVCKVSTQPSSYSPISHTALKTPNEPLSCGSQTANWKIVTPRYGSA